MISRLNKEGIIQAIRFLLTSVAGLLLDFTVALLLLSAFGLPLLLAAALGFVAGLFFNYVIHGIWTFGSSGSVHSRRRIVAYLGATAAALLVRLLTLALLQNLPLTSVAHPGVLLIVSAGVSFMVSFALLRLFVYRGGQGG